MVLPSPIARIFRGIFGMVTPLLVVAMVLLAANLVVALLLLKGRGDRDETAKLLRAELRASRGGGGRTDARTDARTNGGVIHSELSPLEKGHENELK